MITYELMVAERAFVKIKKHIRDLVSIPNLDTMTKDRYRRAVRIWTFCDVTADGFCKILDLRRWGEDDLWDLWGVIPKEYVKVRQTLQRFLERSPLIKLAECAD